jgi:hypothetical protein
MDRGGVLLRVAAFQVRDGRALQTCFFGRHLENADLAALELRDGARTRGRDLVHAVRAVYDPGAVGAEIAERFREGFDPFRSEDTKKLALHEGGVRERTQHVEDRLDAEIGAHGGDMFHRRMMRLGEHEADARLGNAFRDGGGVDVEIDAEFLQRVGCP